MDQEDSGLSWKYYVALGDSITSSLGDPVPGIEPLRWPDRLALALQQLNPRLRYKNLAQEGHTIHDIHTQQYPKAEALHPDLVSIIAGGNDVFSPHWALDQYRYTLENLLQAFRGQGATVLTFTMLNPSAILPARLAAKICARLEETHAIIRDLSNQYQCICVDCWHLVNTHEPGIWSADRKHPNARAHQFIALEAGRCLQQAGVGPVGLA